VKFGALAFVLSLPMEYAINLQLFAGGWILQTLPTIVFGMYTRFFHRRALIAGWLVGLAIATYMPIHTYRTLGHFSSLYALHVGSTIITGFVGLYALGVNLILTTILTLIFDAMRIPRGADRTQPADYLEDTEKPIAA